MATEITPEMRQAIETTGEPVVFVDPKTNEQFVLIRAEFYERMKDLIDWDEPTKEEQRAAFQRFGKSLGWEDSSSDGLI